MSSSEIQKKVIFRTPSVLVFVFMLKVKDTEAHNI